MLAADIVHYFVRHPLDIFGIPFPDAAEQLLLELRGVDIDTFLFMGDIGIEDDFSLALEDTMEHGPGRFRIGGMDA
jgi:hypothetical protein